MNEWQRWMILAAGASAVALLATIALIARGAGRRVPGCSPGSGCDAVASSRWSGLGRLPVTFPAAVVYAAMLACILVLDRTTPRNAALLGHVLIALASACGSAGVWFLALQAVVLRRFCAYCVAAHAAALVAGASILSNAPAPFPLTPLIVGVAAAILLATLQILIPPDLAQFTPTPASQQRHAPNPPPAPDLAPPPTLTPGPARTPLPIPTSAPAPNASPAPGPAPATSPAGSFRPIPSPRRLELLGGRLILDAAAFPFIGSPDAPHVIAAVSDYTCEHCRAMHPIIESALAQLPGQLAVLIVSAPLDRTCNPHIDIADPRYVNACAYAKLGLAVWTTRPEQFAAFHDYLYRGARPPAPDVARRRAIELLGGSGGSAGGGGESALADPRIARQLENSLAIYAATGPGALPRVLMPTGQLIGGSSSLEKFMTLLRQQLLSVPPTTAGTAASTASSPPPRPASGVFSSEKIGGP